MQELKKKAPWEKDASIQRHVRIFISDVLYTISGNWDWELHTDNLFCSDVMFACSPEVTGTRMMLHPDDVNDIKESLLPDLKVPFSLFFRVITTYGQIKSIEGNNLAIIHTEPSPSFLKEYANQAIAEQEAHSLHLLQELYSQLENDTGTGTWYYNLVTQRTWYSNYIYRIYDLPPQSLNAHLNTFYPFIHPDERELVTEYIDEAYKRMIPLHLEFRIVTSIREKTVRYITKWLFSEKGEPVMQGTLRDISEWNVIANQNEELKRTLQFQKHLLLQDEQNGQIGHWQIDLITREVIYTDHFFRLFGQKPQSLAPTLTMFVPILHPDDKDRVTAALKRISTHHQLDDLEFRVIRSDGKVRHLLQKGRFFSSGGTLVVAGTLQDVTQHRVLEQKVSAAKKESRLQQLLLTQYGENAKIFHWLWDVDQKHIAWSDNINSLFGYKRGSSELTIEKFTKYIHTEDRHFFREELTASLEQKRESILIIRFIISGGLHFIKVFLRPVKHEERNLLLATLQDVTDDHQVYMAMKERVRLADALVENIQDRIIITDSSNTIILWSEQCVRLYGIKRDAALGRNFFTVFPQLKNEEEVNLFNRVLLGEAIHQREVLSKIIKGIYNLDMLPLWNDEGTEVTGILHIIHDVTPEAELRRNLNERLHFIEQLLEVTVDRIIVLDRNMNYMYWNRKAEEYYGIDKSNVIGKNILELFPNFRNDPAYDAFRSALRGATVHIPSIQSDDANDYFETYLIPVKNEKQQVTAILWIVHDLTAEWELQQERIKTVHLLHEEHQRLKEVQQIGQVGTFEWIAETGFIYWSDEMYRIYGLEPQGEHMTFERILSFVHPDDTTHVEDVLEQSYSVPGIYTLIHRIIRNDGMIRTIRQQIKTFANDAGKITHLSGTAQDITEQEEKEKLLQEQKHFLQRITETIPDMLSVMELPSRRLTFLNGEVFAANGFDPMIMAEKSREELKAIIHCDDRESLDLYYQQLAEASDDAIVLAEYRALDLSGEWKWFRVRGKVFQRDASGKVSQILNAIQNITDYKVAENELKKSIDVLKQGEIQAGTGSWEYDIQSHTFRWSEGMYALFGLTGTIAITASHYFDLVVPEDRVIIKRIMDQLQNKQQHFEEVYRIKQQNGEHRVIKSIGRVIYNEKGTSEKVIGVDLDITSIRKTEEKLMESHHWLEQTGLASPDAITVYDLQQKQPIYLNQCLSSWVGYSNEALLHMGIEGRLEMMHPDDRSKVVHLNEMLMTAPDDKIIVKQYRLLTAKGTYIWIRNRSKVFQRDAKGKVTHSISFLQDITEEMALGQQLEERKHLVEDILDNSIDRIIVLDTDMNIVSWNRRSEEHFRTKQKDAIGKNLFALFPNIQKDKEMMKAYGDALNGAFIHTPVRQSIYGGGYTEMFYVPLKSEEQKVYGVLTIAHDVSDRIKAEQDLRALNSILEQKNKELEDKNEEITSFAFVASHDLKEPIRKIHTFSDWLLQKEAEHISSTGRSYVAKIAAASLRLEALIEDILVLTKIHSDRQARAEVNLNDILHQIKEELADSIQQSGAIINNEVLPVIHGNSHQLHFLFENLLSNALKFQHAGNIPVISISAKKLAGKAINDKAAMDDRFYDLICFKDNGFGFDPKYSKKIFQVFQRLHRKHEYEGTGMGLAICRKIMENHGGFIRAQAEEDKGATFFCYFPL